MIIAPLWQLFSVSTKTHNETAILSEHKNPQREGTSDIVCRTD